MIDIVDRLLDPNAAWTETLRMEAVAEIKSLRKEGFSLAAWQCVYHDGRTGLVADEHGNSFCAKDKEVQRLRAALKCAYDQLENRLLISALNTIDNALRGGK